MLKKFFHFLCGKKLASKALDRPRARPWLEELDARILPAQYAWTNAASDNLASTAANWADLALGPSAVPGPSDQMLFRTPAAASPAPTRRAPLTST